MVKGNLYLFICSSDAHHHNLKIQPAAFHVRSARCWQTSAGHMDVFPADAQPEGEWCGPSTSDEQPGKSQVQVQTCHAANSPCTLESGLEASSDRLSAVNESLDDRCRLRRSATTSSSFSSKDALSENSVESWSASCRLSKPAVKSGGAR